MEREFDAYKLSRSIYASIFNSFPVIRTASANKNRRFHVPQPTFLFINNNNNNGFVYRSEDTEALDAARED